MMTNQGNRPGALVFVCGLSGMACVAAVTFTDGLPLGERIYWSLVSATFSFFAAMAWLAWPGIRTYREEHRTLQATLRFQRDSLGRGPTVSEAAPAEPKPKASRYGELWRLYWIEMLLYFEQCGGVAFNKTKDFFGKSRTRALATWRQAMKPLVQQGIVWPIAEGERTELSEGFTIQNVRMWFENGHNVEDRYLPPYPPPSPFESAPDQPAEPA